MPHEVISSYCDQYLDNVSIRQLRKSTSIPCENTHDEHIDPSNDDESPRVVSV